MDVASGIVDRYLDITFRMHVVDSSSLVSVLFREAFNQHYISFFILLVNSFSVIIHRCSQGGTLGLKPSPPPSNKKMHTHPFCWLSAPFLFFFNATSIHPTQSPKKYVHVQK